MYNDMLAGIENVKTTALPGGHKTGGRSDYVSSKKDITVSFGNFTIARFHTGTYSRLQSLFKIPNLYYVFGFIDRHSYLNEALIEIEKAIRQHFPEEELCLDLYEDPEGEMDDELAIYIFTKDEPRVALAKLNDFDQNFWLDKIDQYEEFVSVNLRYL